VLLSVAVLVGVPLVSFLPSWEGAGLFAVLNARLSERGRAAVRQSLTRPADATVGWE
jgi:hypothetical protein